MIVRTLLNNNNNSALCLRRRLLTTVTRSCGDEFPSTVMSFGDGSHGALGLPSSVGADAYEPTEVASLPPDICGVGAGHYHSLAVTAGGELWAWGRDLEAQLGRGFSSPRGSWNEPKRVIGLEQVSVVAAFASGVVSAAIGDDGSLWTWGKSKRGQLGLGEGVVEALLPSKVKALSGEKIDKVSFGWGHALARTGDGKLFGWGYSADGRLGSVGETRVASPLESSSGSSTLAVAEKRVLEAMEKENDMPIVWEPCRVTELDGVDIVDIACGLDHSLILCGNGTLLSCGSNAYGQLGRASRDLGMFPVDLGLKPKSIASGLGHSLAICRLPSADEGKSTVGLFSWGWNKSSQLGRAGPESVPMIVGGLDEETPVLVSGGRAHSVALTFVGEAWLWGCGKNGRLGLGSSIDEARPAFLDPLNSRRVLQVVSGFDHNLVLVRS